MLPAAPTKQQPKSNVPAIPFPQAAHEHTEAFMDQTVIPGANTLALPPVDVPAYGFARSILFEVAVTAAGAIGTGVLHEDYPWNLFTSIALLDVNGAPIFGPMDGYSTYVANIQNASVGNPPRVAPNFSAAYTTASFYLRIPLEVSHSTGLAALANQMSNANYKLQVTVNNLAGLFSAVGTATANTYRIRATLEAWSPPAAQDMLGRPQHQAPPAMGTAQYWRAYTVPINIGDNTIPIRQTGNLIRSIAIVSRNATPVRANNVFADPFALNWDARQLLAHSQGVQRLLQRERLADDANVGFDTGVWAFNFGLGVGNRQGDDTPTYWLRTAQSTRMEFKGVSAAAGIVTVIINDIAPVETNPAERYDFPSDTGFTPKT